jgi:hypothetical protein
MADLPVTNNSFGARLAPLDEKSGRNLFGANNNNAR